MYSFIWIDKLQETMALRSILKTVPGVIEGSSGGTIHLYRSILRELPRFMAIYDINIPTPDVSVILYSLICPNIPDIAFKKRSKNPIGKEVCATLF